MVDLDFDVVSLNSRGLRDFTKRRKVFNYMKKKYRAEGLFSAGDTQCSKE